MNNKAIKLWNEDERPCDKIKLHGVEVLTDAELLAVMLGSGTKDKNVVELSCEILDSVGGDLNELARLTLHDLQLQFKGIGEAKAMQMVAGVCDLSLRIARMWKNKKNDCSKLIF